MQCAPKLVCPSQDQPVRMVVSQWLTSVQDYPWASAWLISPDHTRASALQPITQILPSPLKVKWTEIRVISFGDESPRTVGALPLFSVQSSAIHISSRTPDLTLFTSSLERLDRCPPMTWLSGFSKDLPTYRREILDHRWERRRVMYKSMKNN